MADDFLSDEDKALFQSHMKAVKPLKNQTEKINRHPAKATTKSRNTEPKTNITKEPNITDTKPFDLRKKLNELQQTPKTPAQNYFLSDYINQTVEAESILSYRIPDLTTKRFRELKKGQIPWQASLDLHGLTTEVARHTLCDFITKQANKRCVLIIHGKGGYQGNAPVIKNLVNRWLPQMEEVIAFHSALPKDGGQGAIYVLLRKPIN